MKKILALAVAGSLMATSSICVFASEATNDMNVGATGSRTTDANPSITKEDLLDRLDAANQQLGSQEAQIANLEAQNASNESTIRTLQQQFEAFKQAQEKNNRNGKPDRRPSRFKPRRRRAHSRALQRS